MFLRPLLHSPPPPSKMAAVYAQSACAAGQSMPGFMFCYITSSAAANRLTPDRHKLAGPLKAETEVKQPRNTRPRFLHVSRPRKFRKLPRRSVLKGFIRCAPPLPSPQCVGSRCGLHFCRWGNSIILINGVLYMLTKAKMQHVGPRL